MAEAAAGLGTSSVTGDPEELVLWLWGWNATYANDLPRQGKGIREGAREVGHGSSLRRPPALLSQSRAPVRGVDRKGSRYQAPTVPGSVPRALTHTHTPPRGCTVSPFHRGES